MPQQPHATEPVIMQIQPVSIAAAKTALPYAVYKPTTAIHVIDPDSGTVCWLGSDDEDSHGETLNHIDSYLNPSLHF